MRDNRRGFLGKLIAGAAGVGLGVTEAGRRLAPGIPLSDPAQAAPGSDNLVWITDKDPYKATVKAIERLGGMGRFVKKGQRVALLPNVGWAQTVELCGNTHPEVVRAVIDECDKAGAKSMTVFCNPCNDMRVCLEQSGIGPMVEKSPAKFEFLNKNGWRKWTTPKGCSFLKSIEVYRLVEDSDVLINIPVAKHHGGAQLTMCCKNLMGLIKDRGTLHQKLHEGIADLAVSVPHALCVLDASRILLRGGPKGGDPKAVKQMDTVIAGTSPMEVDVLGTTLFNLKPADIGYLRILHERGLVEVDPAKLKVTRA